MSTFRKPILVCMTLFTISFMGCASDTDTHTDKSDVETTAPPETVDPHAGHAHPTHGPHHGDLIELGNEEYHAELLHEENSVTIYILNGAADEQVPIEASEITINVKHDGRPEQFKLAASPDASDPSGKSSRFVSSDEELASHIDEHDAEPKLVLTINGKSYRGEIAHDHDAHADHDH